MLTLLRDLARSTPATLLMAWWVGASGPGAPAAVAAAPLSRPADSAQFEEEDLAPESLFGDQRAATRALFEQAERLFRSAQQPEALPLLDQVVGQIEQRIEQGLADEGDREMLLQALFYRAEAQFNLGDEQATEESLSALLTARPDYRPDPIRISPKLLQRFDDLRNRLVGEARPALQPPDAVLTIAGRKVEGRGATVTLLAGSYTARVTRPGYQGQELRVEVIADRETPVEVELQRVSAVAQILTQPSGVEVLLDGVFAGATSQPAARPSSKEESAAASFALLTIDGLSLGEHLLEVQKEGYRKRRLQLVVRELRDYAFEPIVLEPTAGTLILRSVRSGARIFVDGEERQRDLGSSGPIRLTLPPGQHRLTVTRGTAGWFESDVTLADRQTVDLAIRLKPGLAFLGVLGDDELTAQDLRSRLRDLLSLLEGWVFLDRSAAGPDAVARAGLDSGTLRRRAAQGLESEDLRAWKHLQQEADDAVSGSVYLLAVLSDDLFAKEADLWFLPAAPGPALPERRRVDLEKPDALAALLPYFAPPHPFERATLGVEVIDSKAAEHPVVAFVAPGSPAERAGVRVGERIVELGGAAVQSTAAFNEKLVTLSPGARIQLKVAAGPVTRTVDLALAASPSVVSASDPRLLYPLAWAALAARMQEEEDETPPWVVRLNQAAILLRGGAWAEAIRALRETRAPAEGGLGQAAVDYWLGVALLAADPAAYLASAREAFSRALEIGNARLYHDLGPTVELRARGRLAGISTP
ncbi:MAG: PEGA domain-containing protein [Thermoanaerobaculia bacterium]